MDQQGQLHYDTSQYEPNQVMGNPSQGSVVTSGGPAHSPSQPSGSHLAHHQLAYQHIHHQQQHQLQQQLQSLRANQYQEIEKVNDFKNHNLPLARIKKIMKADEDV
ncbi:Nuclear transcription factor Y subunit C-3 [Camellia lanceoleosa]|uniref:Nuclear transcription factor Y subunit C-3 n=1 Tax=Camellia lanceoleosa TaxID=1840588 RepID=A0ACC0IQT7_9ERIC|nr:Nuclear transcription factor Y subunit C-3 [Camellia lanceoleosa]